jgi:hypothetical protein
MGAITSSIESAKGVAAAGTIAWTWRAVSYSSRWAAQWADKVRSNRSSVLRKGCIAPIRKEGLSMARGQLGHH